MKTEIRGPVGSRTRCNTTNEGAVLGFKACAHSWQTALPDSRLLKRDLLAAVIRAQKAQTVLQDALYVLESQLEAALDSDVGGE